MLTPAQREAAERVIVAAPIGCALDALTDAGFLLLHRDDVTEEERLWLFYPPTPERRLVSRWEPITKETNDG